MMKSHNQQRSNHWSKISADNKISQAQAQQIAKYTDRLKRYFKYMDRKALILHELIDKMLDSQRRKIR
jgi:hypothetical protein